MSAKHAASHFAVAVLSLTKIEEQLKAALECQEEASRRITEGFNAYPDQNELTTLVQDANLNDIKKAQGMTLEVLGGTYRMRASITAMKIICTAYVDAKEGKS